MSKKPGSALINDLKRWKVDHYWHGSRIEAEVEGQEFSINLNGPNKDIRAAHEKIAELLGRQPSGHTPGTKGAKANRKVSVSKQRASFDQEVADLESQIQKPVEMPQNLNFPRAIAAKFAAGVITKQRAIKLTHQMTTVQQREFAREFDRLTGGISVAS